MSQSFEVIEYQYSWNMTKHVGGIRVLYKRRSTWTKWKRISDKAEFLITIQTLQSESPVYFTVKDKQWLIHTAAEPVVDYYEAALFEE